MVNTLKQVWTSQPARIYLKGKPLGVHMVGRNYPVHPDTPIMIGRTTGGRLHQKSNARKVTHPSTKLILAIGGSTSFHGVWVNARGLSYPELVATSAWVMYSIECSWGCELVRSTVR